MTTKKSTNVQSNIALAIARALIRVTRGAPRLAARLVFRAFARPRRLRARPTEELRALAAAERLSIGFGEHTLAAWRWGEGPTVLLVHGWGGRGTQLHALIEPLVAAGWSVVTFDAPAHGASTGSVTTLPTMAAAIARVCAELGPVEAVVAHSLGGAATALALAEGLPVRRAALLAPPADPRPYFFQVTARLGADPVGALTYLEDHVARRLDQLTAEAIGPRVAAEVLVVHDRDDREVPLADGERVAASIRGARLCTTAGLGHRRLLRDAAVIEQVTTFVGQAPREPDLYAAIEADLRDRETRRTAA